MIQLLAVFVGAVVAVVLVLVLVPAFLPPDNLLLGGLVGIGIGLVSQSIALPVGGWLHRRLHHPHRGRA